MELSSVNLHQQHEAKLRTALALASKQSRVAFASACAERLLRQLLDSARKRVFRSALDRLWRDLTAGAESSAWAASALDECWRMIPDGEDASWDARSEDAGGATSYALRCLLTGDAEEAIYASTCVLEAIEYDLSSKGALDEQDNDAWMAHELVRAEFDRQQRDLEELNSGSVRAATLRSRAETEGLELTSGH